VKGICECALDLLAYTHTYIHKSIYANTSLSLSLSLSLCMQGTHTLVGLD
jgi:hypothetical protein